ncbi:Protein TPR2 [Dichanthelium oligosanthes]|uniref:Protein TPR2 n=1 Tax=Dichanthelium oligosanthes TaxID=888268 RepID=A0A1E5VC86_9POAL|nr:Protein TPR2 [Dichanthelium oligosanthes]
MELVTGVMGSLLPKLGELLKEEYSLQKGVRKKIESLSRELEVAHAVLRMVGDVPRDQLDELVRLWVRDVREAWYDMEDIVDAFLVRVDVPEPTDDPHILRRLRKKVGKLSKSKARRKISSLIQDISKKLEEVAERRARYTIDSIVAKPVAATTIDPRILNLYKRATDLVGIDGPRDELITKLSLGGDDVEVPDNKTKVVSVVGFGGLGKTTLAKSVFDHLKPHFECCAFVPVGRNPDVKKVFRDILIGLNKGKYANSDLMVLDEKQLIDELKEFVKEKRCFIVIDDIWDKESWKLIGCALQDSNCGSRVVVTTRIFEVATHAGETYKIQPLSHDNSKKLLYARIVDGEAGKYFDSPSAEVCDKILKKCDGVPLAIITIASLLANKPREDWSEVYKSIGFGHGGNDDVDNTRKILSFSYYDLSSHLKPCLLYLSVFLEDQVIKKNSLIWKWIAEGFIHEEQASGVGLFELGERYFFELINRSMIQPVETDECYVDGCHVHDMVFDLVLSLSSHENFITVLDGDEWQKLLGSIARRILLQRIQEHNRATDSLMDECQVEEDGDQCHLGSLLHLRYLRLSDTGIYELPREVRYLKFLQTLDLWESGSIVELPKDVGLLTQLVCLRVDWDIGVPAGLIGKLTSLQELWIRPPDDDVEMQFVKELGMLRELRVLMTCIHVTSEIMEKALWESLGNLHNIRTLDVQGSPLDMDGTEHTGFLSSRHLQYLCLKCFVFSGLPAWMKSSLALSLSHLDLTVPVVNEQDMETLARLFVFCIQMTGNHFWLSTLMLFISCGNGAQVTRTFVEGLDGRTELLNLISTLQILTTFIAPTPAATFLAFHRRHDNIIAIGMEDSSIQIYDVLIDEVKSVLRGHWKKITGLTFSESMNVLVSSGADAQLCVWSIDGWEKKKSRYIQPPSNASGGLVDDTMVQFHYDQKHLLVVHESQLAIYDGKRLECLHSWSPRDALPSPISSAVYSSDGLMIYAGFRDGAIGIFEAECLRLQFRVAPSAYIASSISSGGEVIVYPMAVAANPWKPNQIAVGMSDGAIYVLEPLDDDMTAAIQ